ncbi:MAG: hypothetical protein KUG79_06980 [Pseudomonadales bacterium]|nr:hypothetical protein [Pseudomonadales bacterium]
MVRQLASARACLLKLAIFISLVNSLWLNTAFAQEWQQIPSQQGRLKPQPDKDQSAQQANKSPPTIYKSGEGALTGAFGIDFDLPLKAQYIKKHLGWVKVKKLPSKLVYFGTVKPFDLKSYLISPPIIPPLLREQNVEYQVYVDFAEKPLWIIARYIPNMDKVIDILTRKYGALGDLTSRKILFALGNRQIHIDRGGSRGTLTYLDMANFKQYLTIRNLKIRRKYNELERKYLNPRERLIMDLADQMVALRQDMKHAMGITFGQRVGFRASPDQYSLYNPAKPFTGMGKGTYRIMVNPKLIPISVHFELTGNEADLLNSKQLLDHALEIAFGGFLKRTPKHSVLSLQGNSIAVLIRKGRMRLTVVDSAENKAYSERLRDIELAAQLAETIRQRKAEIKFEKGF